MATAAIQEIILSDQIYRKNIYIYHTKIVLLDTPLKYIFVMYVTYVSTLSR